MVICCENRISHFWKIQGLLDPFSTENHHSPRLFPVRFRFFKIKTAFAVFIYFVAGTGIEPMSGGYEPPEVPLLYPAIYHESKPNLHNSPPKSGRLNYTLKEYFKQYFYPYSRGND